ncbi:MAG TPA: hypothetical protein VGO21_04545 [Candidatus Paceibacterota bacterium]|jgi:hypothetical protein|nr:hypothetical protein [Candidatus Paceibacterota bacterium]
MKNTQKGFIVPLLLGILVLVAAGGVYYYKNKKTETPNIVQPTAEQQNSPVEQSQSVQNSTSITAAEQTSPTKFKTVTNNVLNFSVNIPKEYNLAVDVITGKPVNYRYAIKDASGKELPATVTIQMHAGKIQTSNNYFETDTPFFIENEYYTPYIKSFTTETGLKGIIYNNPNPDPTKPSSAYGKIVTTTKEAVVIPYPISSTQKSDTSLNTQLKYPLIEISMSSTTDTAFTAEQQELFMKVVNSFKFTGNTPSYNAPVKTVQPDSSSTSTIKLDATTKVAVVQAIMNGIDILSSNDATKIRTYMLTELDGTAEGRSQKAQFVAMTDSQILQLATNGVANEGKPTADLATDSTAVWKVNGNTVTVTHKTYAKPNPAYPAIANLDVTYQAVYVNGAWH